MLGLLYNDDNETLPCWDGREITQVVYVSVDKVIYTSLPMWLSFSKPFSLRNDNAFIKRGIDNNRLMECMLILRNVWYKKKE